MKILPLVAPKDFPQLKFEFEALEKVDDKQKNDTIDVIGICKSYDDMQAITLKNGVPGQKREIVLIDPTKEVLKFENPD